MTGEKANKGYYITPFLCPTCGGRKVFCLGLIEFDGEKHIELMCEDFTRFSIPLKALSGESKPSPKKEGIGVG